jgi:hypothetical protein
VSATVHDRGHSSDLARPRPLFSSKTSPTLNRKTEKLVHIVSGVHALMLSFVQVGPGSYTPKDKFVEHAYAPFSSTATRHLQGGPTTTGAFTPGPGHYDIKTSAVGRAALRMPADVAAPFHSTGPKIGIDKSSAVAAPGPGQYDCRAPVMRQTHRYAFLNRTFQTQQKESTCA